MTAKLAELISQHLSKRKAYKDGDWLLQDIKGNKMERYGLRDRLERIGKKTGVKVTAHALRRAFVTINSNKGRPLVMLQMACGHADIQTTRSYCMTSEQEVIDAMKEWD